ncbi:MAG: class I SAM-dependent methyltransferase [Cytophagales bacterium]|jgi:trans-aconitate methyltransferase|nr:class I SAM-dependent methyltransferase [Cytophagales bacterium]
MESYHDYVIKDGQFVGKFDEMYRKFDNPWTQVQQPNPYARQAGILHLQKYGIRSVVECGSGLGYYSDMIHRNTGIVPKGIDISPTAVEKAKTLFPHLDFRVDLVQNLRDYRDCEAVLFAEITWYVLPDLDSLFQEMFTHFAGKYFINNLVFYKGTQKYGTEYFTSLREFIDYVPFKMLAYCEATTAEDSTIETSSIFRIEPK